MVKRLVIFDSLYGNTQKVAEAIGETVGAKVVSVKETNPDTLKDFELLVFGSPTHGGQAKPEAGSFLKRIPADGLKGLRVAAFDTRADVSDQGFFLKTLMRTIGFAAPKIAKTLAGKGGELVGEPTGFIVEGKEGPLRKGEINRAEEWANGLV